MALWKDVGLWSHINLTSNPKRHWAVGVGSEKLREGGERSQQRFAIQQVHSVGSEGAAELRALGDSVECAQRNHSQGVS